MSARRLRSTCLLVLLLLLAGCTAGSADDELSGNITLWHTWSPDEARVLEAALSQFEEIHPNVNVIPLALPEEQILEQFSASGNAGLGPALLLGSDSWIGELVNTGLIRSLPMDSTTAALFNTRNSALMQYEDSYFGMPMALELGALYYNKRLVTSPPDTLDELLQEAAAGNQVVFVPRFEKAYWGIQAFGAGLFDDAGRFTLAESGFIPWLAWLESAQSAPGVILNVDDDSLLELFVTEKVAYYVAGPEKLAAVARMIDKESPFEFGVAPLPSGPQGKAGPLLQAETILLYNYSSAAETRAANALASFLVNQQQSISFMRELDHVPANPGVRVDGRIYPVVNGFSQQARTAVVIPNEIATGPLVAAGDRAYAAVLSGVLSPEEAVCLFGQEVAAFQGYALEEIGLPPGCEIQAE